MTVATEPKVLGGSGLFPGVPDNTVSVVMVTLASLRPAPDNPRRDVGDVTELAESMKSGGVLQPLVVCPDGGSPPTTFKIVIGHRRYAAAQLAGLRTVPVLVRRFTEQERLEAMLVENLQRSELAPIEEATAFRKLTDAGLSQRAIAERIGRSQAHVSRRLALLELPSEAVQALDTGSITVEDAVELTKLKDMPKRQAAALKEGTGHSWRTVREAVKNQLEDHQRAEQRGKLLRDLKSAGVKLLDVPHGLYGRPEKWLAEPGRSYYSSEDLPIDLKAHAKEPCRAVVSQHNIDVRYACAEPARHARKGASQLKAQRPRASADPATAKRREEERQVKEDGKRRQEFVKQLLTGPLQVDDVLGLAAEGLIYNIWDEGLRKLVAGLLGLEGHKKEQLLGHAKRLPAETLMALTLARLEHTVFSWRAPDGMRSYLIWLSGQGYELTPAERKLGGLDESPPTEAETDNLPTDDPMAIKQSYWPEGYDE
jgi:ParB/RepB/Spo0J family partition protein